MIVSGVNNISSDVNMGQQVPRHWQFIRIKNLFKEIDKRSESGKEDLLSVSQYTGVTLRKDAFEDGKEITNAKTLKGYKIVEHGDLVVNIMLAWNGCLGVSPFNGITSPAYCVYRVRDESKLNPEYFGYLFSTTLFKSEFKKRSTGIIESRLRLYSDDFFRILCFVPPKVEQDKIVAQINEESSKISLFIQSKQHFIELLKEQRKSIITQAVTKGIADNVKMIETGVDWISNIPENWNKRRLRFLVKITTGKKNTEDKVPDGDYPFYVRSQTIERIDSFSFDGEGILTAGDGVGVGKVFHYVNGKFNFHQRVYLFYDIHSDIEGEFLFNYLQVNMMSELMRYNSKSTVDSIRLPVIKNFLVVFPERKEQKGIVEHIKTETRTLDITISKAEREIELIKEYREAMIAEAVTGKMKL
jgi:type I restriction enzyme S subunit